jgi:hypothetical protein
MSKYDYTELVDLIGQDSVGAALEGGYIKESYTDDPELKEYIKKALDGIDGIKKVLGDHLQN